MSIDSQSIGARIASARNASGFSLSEVANRLDVHPTAVHAWEKGRNLAAVLRFARLCETLGVSADELLGLGRGAS